MSLGRYCPHSVIVGEPLYYVYIRVHMYICMYICSPQYHPYEGRLMHGINTQLIPWVFAGASFAPFKPRPQDVGGGRGP